MKGTLAIIGSGDLGQQIAHYAISDGHYQKIVFFDDFAIDAEINNHAILGKTDAVEAAFKNSLFDEMIIGIGYKHLNFRKALFDRFENKIPFGTIIHSTCWVDKTATINKGCVIYPNCSVDAQVTIDSNSVLNINCSISHDSYIGKHCFLSPRVAMAGFVNLKEQSIVGINATIIDNITITENTQIGGGTVVINNITQSGLYVGNPAKFIR